MKPSASIYQQTVARLLHTKLVEQGFREVQLRDCMSYEVLFRKGDLWFGTSWDERDQYLDLDFGHLCWVQDVMPRVIVVGQYASFCDEVKHLDQTRADYLEVLVATVARTLETALQKYRENSAFAETRLAKLRPHILGKATDAELAPHEA